MAGSGPNLITLRARLADGLYHLMRHTQAALLLSLLFALINLLIVKLFALIDPGLATYIADRSGRQDHTVVILMIQTLGVMSLMGHGVIWARLCLLGQGHALDGGLDGFFRRFSSCLTRLLVAALMAIAVSIPLFLLAALLTTVLQTLGSFGQSMAFAASITLMAIPIGAVVAALILSVSAEAIDRRLSVLAAMQQTQPAWVRLSVVILVLAGGYALAMFGLFLPLLGPQDNALPAGIGAMIAYILRQGLAFMLVALSIGALAPLLRDRKKRQEAEDDGS